MSAIVCTHKSSVTIKQDYSVCLQLPICYRQNRFFFYLFALFLGNKVFFKDCYADFVDSFNAYVLTHANATVSQVALNLVLVFFNLQGAVLSLIGRFGIPPCTDSGFSSDFQMLGRLDGSSHAVRHGCDWGRDCVFVCMYWCLQGVHFVCMSKGHRLTDRQAERERGMQSDRRQHDKWIHLHSRTIHRNENKKPAHRPNKARKESY